jgi:plasmid stabilization system protein ParE
MRVSYSPRAVSQINQAFDYIAQDNPAAARAFMARVESLAALFSARPEIGRMTSRPGVHVIGLLPYRYLLFYKVLSVRDEIRIVRLRHMSRRNVLNVRGL